MKKLSHYDEQGRASMVDVSAKPETKRTAEAHAFVRIKRSVLSQLPDNPKGNPLEVARFAGTREDRSGAALAAKVAEFGWAVAHKKIVSDDEEKISSILIELTDVDMILSTGGTGVAPRDVTPEATAAVSDRKIDGFGELM